jgi:hypothetical protein
MLQYLHCCSIVTTHDELFCMGFFGICMCNLIYIIHEYSICLHISELPSNITSGSTWHMEIIAMELNSFIYCSYYHYDIRVS